MNQTEIDRFNDMSTSEKWQHILITYLDQNLPVPAHFVRWILFITAPTPKEE